MLAFRERESQLLSGFFDGLGRMPDHLFITGPPQCGKKSLVTNVLRKLKAEEKLDTVVALSALPGCIHVREILEDIMRQVNGDEEVSVPNLSELVAQLKVCVTGRCVIVLTEAEHLRDLEPLVLPGFLRLAELTGRAICVVLVSQIHWSRWPIAQWTSSPPYTVCLAPYSSKQLSSLLTSQLASLVTVTQLCNQPAVVKAMSSTDFVRNFVELIVGTFSMVCRSLPDLMHVSQALLPAYCAPLIEASVEPSNTRALWRHAEPHVKQCLASIHLGERSLGQHQSAKLNVELPFYSKFLLISAFLASYNPAKSDKRFFVKNSGRMRKTKNASRVAAHKRSSQLLGPKPFPLDRMLAMFHVIVDHQVPPRSKLLSQVTSLVSLKLLSQVGSSDVDSLDAPRYKCNVGLDFIRSIAQNVKFEIHKYLYDVEA